MSKILRYLVCLFMLFFVGQALAISVFPTGGYTCPAYKMYNDCSSGYYVSDCPTSQSSWNGQTISTSALTPQNSCEECPAHYVCAGGLVCPEPEPVYITYDLNGGAGVAPATTTCQYGRRCNLESGDTNSFYRAGYVFKGWGTASTSTTGNTYIIATAGRKVYAVWEPCEINEYKDSTANASAACSACPAVTAGFEYYGSTGKTSASSCLQVAYDIADLDSDCSGVSWAGSDILIMQRGNADGTGWGLFNVMQDILAKPGNYVSVPKNYTSADPFDWDNICVPCTSGTYSAGGPYTNGQCQSCPALTEGFEYTSATGMTSVSQCAQVSYSASALDSDCSNRPPAGKWFIYQSVNSDGSGWGAFEINDSIYSNPGNYTVYPQGYTSETPIDWGTLCEPCSAGTYSEGDYVTQCQTCENWTYSGNGAASCTACPAVTSGWSKQDSTGTGWTSYTKCIQVSGTPENCTAGSLKQTATASGTWGTSTIGTPLKAEAGAYVSGQTCELCSAGTYQETSGSTATSCTVCGTNSYSSAGAATCSSCNTTNGYTNTGSTASSHAGVSSCKTTCDAGEYVASAGAACTTVGTGYWKESHTVSQGSTSTRNQCPANYRNGGAGATESDCKTNCSGGYRVSVANAACSAITSGNVYIGAHTVNYGSLSPAASSCPTSYTISGNTAADHDQKSDCKISCLAGTQVVTADAACTTPASSWYSGAHTVSAGSTSGTNVKSCLTNYSTPSTTTRTDHDTASDCTISCAAGTRIVSANATSCTTPSGNWYVGEHSVSQGSISSVNNCLANYLISGTAASNHDNANDCKITCDGGSYIAAANDTTCDDVGVGYWAAESTVSQGSKGVRNACGSGLTTIGFGAGADEAGDCGRVLNVNGDKIYLRSVKKTTPSLNVSISGQTFYGNMGTSTVGSLKIKSSGTTYSVYDDSME